MPTDRDLWWAVPPDLGYGNLGGPTGLGTPDERRRIDELLNPPYYGGAAERPPSFDFRPLLPGFQGGRDLARGIVERDPWGAAWGAGQIALGAFPFGRAPRPPPAGPWTQGHIDRWLASRPRPALHDLNRQLAIYRPPPAPPPQPPMPSSHLPEVVTTAAIGGLAADRGWLGEDAQRWFRRLIGKDHPQ